MRKQQKPIHGKLSIAILLKMVSYDNKLIHSIDLLMISDRLSRNMVNLVSSVGINTTLQLREETILSISFASMTKFIEMRLIIVMRMGKINKLIQWHAGLEISIMNFRSRLICSFVKKMPIKFNNQTGPL